MNKFLLFIVFVIGAIGVFVVTSKDDLKKPQINPPVKPTPQPPKVEPPKNEPNVLDVLKPTFQEAQKNDKKVLLFLSTEGCIWCDKAKADVFPKIQQELKPYVVFETKDKNVSNEYKVQSFPTFIILDKNGKELKRHTGYMTAIEFSRWLK